MQRAIAPEAAALGFFGAIASAITLLVCGLAVGRQVRAGAADRQLLRELGASPVLSATDGLPLVGAAVLAGVLLAVVMAIGLSALAPIGPVRAFLPTRVSFDWTVLGVGAAVLAVGMTGAVAAVALRFAPWRSSSRPAHSRRSGGVNLAGALGLPESMVVGTWFAFGRGAHREAAPVRSVAIGTVVGVATVVCTLTFSAGLSHLVSSPSLYGWNWNVAVLNGNGIVPQQYIPRLRHDPDVSGWWAVSTGNLTLNGQNVPAVLSDAPSSLGPTMLSGRGVANSHQIVLGAATMDALHLHVGDVVTASYGTPTLGVTYVPPTKLRIVGTAAFPAYGSSGTFNADTSMGTGAWVSIHVEPPRFRAALVTPDPLQNGWDAVFVRFRSGVSATAGRASLEPIVRTAATDFANDVQLRGGILSIVSTLRPAEIVDYRTVGATPVVFACGLAAGAGFALALSLVTSVRRRRRDLALLKALGFGTRQIRIAIVWQAILTVAVGIVIGVPIGIVGGRALWVLFAHTIDASPVTVVPVTAVVLVALGCVLFAALVSVLPGRTAARTPIWRLLHSE